MEERHHRPGAHIMFTRQKLIPEILIHECLCVKVFIKTLQLLCSLQRGTDTPDQSVNANALCYVLKVLTYNRKSKTLK